MPEYKLTYFNFRAKGEVIRYLFALAGVPYEDIRIEREDWPSKKEAINAPFGQMPILSIDGVVYCQSHPIARYLAEKFGYAGKTDLDRLRADMIAHCCEDMLLTLVKVYLESDDAKKNEIRTKVKEEFQTHLTNFDNILKQNNGGDGYFVGDSLTWADLTFYQFVTFAKSHAGIEWEPILDTFPKLKALRERVEQVPQIAAWMAKRPDNPF